MKITKLMVEDFGKFHQEEFRLAPGLNVATGANESGKTTLRQFLLAMWYGLERERGIKARQDDYTRYKPWYSGRFRGSMELEADGSKYRLSRNFLTTEKSVGLINLATGKVIGEPEEFLQEQGLVPEAVYRNTFWIGDVCRTEEVLAENLQNHMANFAYTGGMNLNLKASAEFLKKQKKEIEKRIPETELHSCMEIVFRETQWKERFARETTELTEIQEQYRRAEQKQNEGKEKLSALQQEWKTAAKKQEKQQIGQWICVLCGVIGMLIAALSFLDIPAFLYVGIVIVALGLTVGIGFILKNRNHRRGEIEEEIELLQARLFSGYEAMKQFLPMMEKKRLEIEQTEEQLQACEAAEKRQEELRKIKEKWERELAAVRLAEDTLEAVSMELYEEYGERFQMLLSGYVKAFTDGVYTKLTADENLKLRAITEERSVEVTEVSRGTGEQFYLALRLAAADIFDPEKRNPMILDESLAAFDEQRMESALLALASCGRQVLLFSSTGREEQALRRMGVAYEEMFKNSRENHMDRD